MMTTIINPLRKTNVDDAGDYTGPVAKPHIASGELAELYAMVTSLTVRVAILEHGQAYTDAVVHRYINDGEVEVQP